MFHMEKCFPELQFKIFFLPQNKEIKKKSKLKVKLCCLGESGRAGPEQLPPFLRPKLTWKSTLCPRFEAITPGVRFKTFVCQHDSREQGCNLMRGQREWETQHGPGSSGRSSVCYWLKGRGFIGSFVFVPSSLGAWVLLSQSRGLKWKVYNHMNTAMQDQGACNRKEVSKNKPFNDT